MKNLSKKIIAVIIAVAMVATLAVCLVACDNDPHQGGKTDKTTYRFALPDGTPALAIARLFSENKTIADANINYEIIAPTSIQTEIGSGNADLIIMPTNAGAALINKGADYKLASVSVEGSLYVIGKPDKATGENNTITIDDFRGKKIVSIGQNKTPDKIFKYIIDNTDGVDYNYEEGKLVFSNGDETSIQFVAKGANAKQELVKEGGADFAVVGEPVATVFGTPNGGGFSARMDLQAMYKNISGFDNYPQASLFVKSSIAKDTKFMDALYDALAQSKDWVLANSDKVTDQLKPFNSVTPFPAPCISRCNIGADKITDADKDYINSYLKLMVPSVDWTKVDLF